MALASAMEVGFWMAFWFFFMPLIVGGAVLLLVGGVAVLKKMFKGPGEAE